MNFRISCISKNVFKILFALSLILVVSSCSTSKIQTKKSSNKNYSTKSNSTKNSNSSNKTKNSNLSGKVFKKDAVASYYHDKFNGRSTASGEKFNNNKLTAAHKTLEFGTVVKVTNIANNKSVIVTINDRGPFSKGREIDLSKKAFFEISDKSSHGTLNVNIEIL